MKFSSKIEKCGLSPMRKFAPYAAEAVKKGKKVYHLNIGQPDIATPEAYFEAVTAKQVEHRALCLRIAQQQHVFLAVCGRRERIDARLPIDKADARHNIAAYGVEGYGGGQRQSDHIG